MSEQLLTPTLRVSLLMYYVCNVRTYRRQPRYILFFVCRSIPFFGFMLSIILRDQKSTWSLVYGFE
jgi:hypothetical protein